MAQVTITIDENAETTIKVNGVAGGSCKDLTRAIERAIGVTTGDTKTPEFFASAKAGVQTVKAGQ